MTVFVDDLASIYGYYDNTALLQSNVLNDFLDACLSDVNMVQNLDKQELIVRVFGHGASNILWQIQDKFKEQYKLSARYLGPYLQWDGSNIDEIKRRISAGNAAWFVFRSFWQCAVDQRFKNIVFKSIVVSIMFSGLVAFVLSNNEMRILTAAIIKLGRKLLRGRAWEKVRTEQGMKYKAWSNVKVLRHIGMADAALELSAGKEESEDERLKRMEMLLTLVKKLSLSSAQQVRMLRSVTVSVFRIAATSPFIVTATEHVSRYTTAPSTYEDDDAKQAAIGLPHHHMFIAFLTVALSRATELLSEKAALDKFLASIRNVTPDAKCIALQDQARHCKVAKAFHSHHKKLEPMIRPGSDAEEVWSKGKEANHH